MVLFPEGGFLRKRRETSKRYALKNNLPVLEHVSLPRTGAMEAIVEEVAVPYQPNSKFNHVSQSSLHSGKTKSFPCPFFVSYKHLMLHIAFYFDCDLMYFSPYRSEIGQLGP